jgi:phosphoribosylformylglycinamidine synthase subunit PurS
MLRPLCGLMFDVRGLGPWSLTYNDLFMTAYVYVSLKKSVLDPQGKTIQGALKKMGYKGLESVRQGKYFELTLDGGLSRDEAQTEVERIAREVLTNPVIEEFRFSLAE